MKKVLSILAIALVVSACGGASTTTETADSAAVAVDTAAVATDTTAVIGGSSDTTTATVPTEQKK